MAPTQKQTLCLLEVSPETGRTHQIRVHLAEAHHPIVGDTHYGAKSYLSSIEDDSVRTVLESLERPFLHAARLEFTHPVRKERNVFSAPFPADLSNILRLLKKRLDGGNNVATIIATIERRRL